MKSWSKPRDANLIPEIGGLRLFDTRSQTFLNPISDNSMNLYVCGVTPYDSAHLGHAFTYLTFDTLIRVARDTGAKTTYVQNVTDIDEPLFERAISTGQKWQELSRSQTDIYCRSMQKINLLPPDHFLPVTENIKSIIKAAESIADQSYKLGSTTYFKSSEIDSASFTQLSIQELIKISRDRGGDPETPGKQNALDPKLWVPSINDEPRWDSKFGVGRPGWHIECIALSDKVFGGTFDVQGGGEDLIYPHHALCDQMSIALHEKTLARIFAHVGLVSYEDEKMSKSKGNLVFVDDLIKDETDSQAVRVLLLNQPWQTAWEYHEPLFLEARSRFMGWVQSYENAGFGNPIQLIHELRLVLRNNLNSQAALSLLDKYSSVQSSFEERKVSADAVWALLGLDLEGNRI